MASPKPVTLVNGANPTPGFAPEPLVVVGGGAVTKQAAVVNLAAAGTLADLTAAQASDNTIITKVNAILAALRAAGVIAP